MELTLFHQMAIVVALGLLVGLQRERKNSRLAGIRTFPLIGLFGLFCGVFSVTLGVWVVTAGLLAVAALTIMGNVLRLHEEERASPGMTTEIAILVVFGIGVGLARDLVVESIVAGAVLAVLLHWKAPLHGFAQRIGADEFAALMRLVLIALVVLPVLPNESYGPYDVLNPFQIWLIVVLIVGISMAGYVAFRLFGSRTGAIAAGLLGGVISSTATTVSYARRSGANPARSPAAALVIVLASTVVFGRVLFEIGLVAPGILAATAPPLIAMMVVMLAIGVGLYLLGTGPGELELEDQAPPSELGPAVVFGFLYAVILLAVAFAEDRVGTSGLYLVAVVSGLTDVDAITLSTAQLMRGDGLDVGTGWRMIMVGALANTAFKGGVVMVLGSPGLRKRIAVAFGIAIAGGLAIIWLWPG